MERHNRARSGSESKPENLLRSCASLLSLRDFNSCREFAHRVPRSDPNISFQVDQILSIADVLGAADRRLHNHHLDWYSILQLRRSAAAGNRDLVRHQFKKLVRLLDPNKNKFPFSDEALMRVREAWFVLSDPARRTRFDHETGSNVGNLDGAAASSSAAATTSFWTMCPYCWYLHEYEGKYKDCTLRCGHCRRTFHGVAVKPPAPEMVVEGKEQYYCYNVSLPLRYPMDERHRFDFEDDDDVRASCERVVQGNGRSMGFQGNGKKRMRIKTVANRVRMKGFVDDNRDLDLDEEEEENLKFTKGNGGVFVGVQFGE